MPFNEPSLRELTNLRRIDDWIRNVKVKLWVVKIERFMMTQVGSILLDLCSETARQLQILKQDNRIIYACMRKAYTKASPKIPKPGYIDFVMKIIKSHYTHIRGF